jgi:hypothetical protein
MAEFGVLEAGRLVCTKLSLFPFKTNRGQESRSSGLRPGLEDQEVLKPKGCKALVAYLGSGGQEAE